MAVQARLNIDTTDFIIREMPAHREDNAIIAEDAGRATDLLQYTLMGKVAATEKWVPFTDETATDGSAENFGIYMGADIAAADIVAGDVIDNAIIYRGLRFDEDKLVIENSKTLATVIGATTIHAHTVRDGLHDQDLIPQKTQTATDYENA
jgi:hypothetical protein